MNKKAARLENRKRKLQAFANITELNEKDKDEKLKTSNKAKNGSISSSGSNSSDDTDSEPQEKRTKQLNVETFTVHGPSEKNEKDIKSDTIVETTLTSCEEKTTIITQEDYLQLKRELNQKRRELKSVPKLRLKLFGDNASLGIDPSIRTPIFLTDIQHLIMYVLLGSSSPCIPSRWCSLEKASKISHTVVLVVDGISLFHYSSYESLFKNCTKIFENKLEVIIPNDNTNDLMNEFLTVPLTDVRKSEFIEKYGSLEAAMDATKNPVSLVNTVFPVSGGETTIEVAKKYEVEVESEVFPRTKLLLSALQMVDEGYPLPLRGELANRYKDFVLTKSSYKEVTDTSPMFALDCEMCRTSAGINELTRISVINEQHTSIYETLVRPQYKIIDYLTPFSGITPQMMQNVTKTLAEVQEDIRQLLPPDAILVGQSLQSDLMAMRMMHPYVIDTSVIFNLSGDKRRKSKLQTLASEFLGESIQKNPLGHDSIEDCSASLKLTKLKLTRGIDFGDTILTNRRQFYEKMMKSKVTEKTENGTIVTTTTTDITTTSETVETTTTFPTTTENVATKKDRSTAVVTSSEVHSTDYKAIINNTFRSKDNANESNASVTAIDCDNISSNQSANIHLLENTSNKQAVQKTCQIALEHALTLTHLNVKENRLSDENIEKTLKKVDRWISKIWDCVAPKGLFVVIFAGNKSTPDSTTPSGVALLQTK